jgi:hypothetical protein
MQRISKGTSVEYGDGLTLKIAVQFGLLLMAFVVVTSAPTGGVLRLDGPVAVLERVSPLGRTVTTRTMQTADLHEAFLQRTQFTGERATRSMAHRIVLHTTDGRAIPLTIHYGNRRWEMSAGAARINEHLRRARGETVVAYDDHRIVFWMAIALAALGGYGLLWGAFETRIRVDRNAGGGAQTGGPCLCVG